MAIGPVFVHAQSGLSSPHYSYLARAFLVRVSSTRVLMIWILWSELLWFNVQIKIRDICFVGIDALISSQKFHINILKTAVTAQSQFFWGNVTLPDLVTWPEVTLGWTVLEEWKIDVWKGMQKARWYGKNDPLTRAKVTARVNLPFGDHGTPEASWSL